VHYGLEYVLACSDLVRWIHLAFVSVVLNLRGKGKGKVRPRTGHVGPEGE
jgi:hypothetical protein